MKLARLPLAAIATAAAVALLLILPAFAQIVEDTQQGPGGETLTINVQQQERPEPAGDNWRTPDGGNNQATLCDLPSTLQEATDTVSTRFDRTTYVSNSGAVVLCHHTAGGDVQSPIEILVNLPTGTAPNRVPANHVVLNYTRASGTTNAVDVIVNSPSEPGPRTIGTLASDNTSATAFYFWVVGSLPDGKTSTDTEFQVDRGSLSGDEAPVIYAKDGDVLTISAGTLLRTITVDGKGPSFTGVAPAHGTMQRSLSTTIQFTVSDAGSGIIPHAITGGRPAIETGGGAVNIDVNWDGTGNHETRGDNNWSENTEGRSYSVAYGVGNLSEKEVDWYIEGWDRLNNHARTDADPDDAGDQPYTFEVDITAPALAAARTGVAYDAAGQKEVRDSASVRVEIDDAIDSSRLRIDDFSVQGAEVIGFVHPDNSPKIEIEDRGADHEPTNERHQTTCSTDKALGHAPVGTADAPNDARQKTLKAELCVDTRKHVYLALSKELADDATPDVTVYGGALRDSIDNVEDGRETKEAVDGILPTLTVTLAGDAGGVLAQREIALTIDSSEPLDGATATLAEVNDKGEVTGKTQIVSLDGSKGTSSRTGTIKAQAGVWILKVTGTDEAKNTRTLEADDLAGYKEMGLRVVFDNAIDETPAVQIRPEAGGKSNETESPNPFAVITFAKEAEEKDGFDEITLTSLTVDGEDKMGDVERGSDTEFNLALFDLAVGAHELAYTASDPAGNSRSYTWAFEVLERSRYAIALRPGWNLVSVPDHPADKALAAVMGDNPATQVVAYQEGEWLSAVKSDDGTWAGTLGEIVAGYGYWVETRTFQALEVAIPEADPGDSLLPTVAVVEGWNLLGVMDPSQADPPAESKAGCSAEGEQAAKDYFSGFSWAVAYGYDPRGRTWEKVNNDDANSCVSNGAGYWLYADSAATLTP